MSIKEMKLVPQAKPEFAVLIKENDLHSGNIGTLAKFYINRMGAQGIDRAGFRSTFIGLPYPVTTKKPKKADALIALNEILEYCDNQGIENLLVPDSVYFPFLTGRKSTEPSIDDVYPCIIEGYEHINVAPCVHYTAIAISPNKANLLDRALKVFSNYLLGNHEKPGQDVLRDYKKLMTADELKEALNEYMLLPTISCDIETTSLRFYDAEVLTIGFGKDKHSAICCAVHNMYHSKEEEAKVKDVLKRFFSAYKGKVLFHNALYDCKVLAYRLFMKDLEDVHGLEDALKAFKNVQDTMIIAYLAINSTIRMDKGLKDLSKEFMGEYAEDVKDAISVPLNDLMVYNAKDCCATWYVFDKYYPMMVADSQEQVHDTMFQPSIEPLLKMVINGLPIDLTRVSEARELLSEKLNEAIETLKNSHYVKRVVSIKKHDEMLKYNSSHKKQKTIDEIEFEFNPGSDAQVRILVFDVLGFDIIEKTKGGQGSVKRDFLEEYLEEAKAHGETDVIECLEALINVSQIGIILSTFLNAFETMSTPHPDGTYYLKGNLKLGGTQSGRLSSSEPNMQNLPSGSTYGKIIKNCFVAPKGWLFAGADFSALEDRIGAILANDSAKKREFSEGMDGHSARALAFFADELPPLDPNSTDDVNSIKRDYKDIRDKAKSPSFALQYGGGPGKIQLLLKCDRRKADEVYKAYHSLYSGLAEFSEENKKFGMANGYVEGAFGLRLRTPRLLRHKKGTRESPEVGTEARSASNMVTQSWGMLMNRAFIEFNERLKSSKYLEDIKLLNTIHDAVYLLVREDPEIIKWVNDNLVECMQWQLGKIESNEVKMEAEVDFGVDWAHQETLHNNATIEEIEKFLKEQVHATH